MILTQILVLFLIGTVSFSKLLNVYQILKIENKDVSIRGNSLLKRIKKTKHSKNRNCNYLKERPGLNERSLE